MPALSGDTATWFNTLDGLGVMAPEEGFEPPAKRLTVACSTTELLRNACGARSYRAHSAESRGQVALSGSFLCDPHPKEKRLRLGERSRLGGMVGYLPGREDTSDLHALGLTKGNPAVEKSIIFCVHSAG